MLSAPGNRLDDDEDVPGQTTFIRNLKAEQATPSYEAPATVPVGRSGNPIIIQKGTNQPGSFAGRDYAGHSFDQMQGRGIPPSSVESTISNGVQAPGNIPGTTTHYNSVNNLTVVTNSITGRVVTVRQGPP